MSSLCAVSSHAQVSVKTPLFVLAVRCVTSGQGGERHFRWELLCFLVFQVKGDVCECELWLFFVGESDPPEETQREIQ